MSPIRTIVVSVAVAILLIACKKPDTTPKPKLDEAVTTVIKPVVAR